MKKSTKGALAGSAAALLLMAGLGTQDAWQGSSTIDGSAIQTGRLSLTQDCDDPWQLGVLTGTLDPVTKTVNGTVAGLADVTGDVADLKLVPGDLLQRVCTITVHVQGTRLTSADLTLNQPTLTGNDAGSSLVAVAQYKKGATALASGADLNDGDVITATVSVNLKEGLTGLTGQNLTSQLNDISITANPN